MNEHHKADARPKHDSHAGRQVHIRRWWCRWACWRRGGGTSRLEMSRFLAPPVAADHRAYRLCYIRGPEGILIGLAQELGQQTSR